MIPEFLNNPFWHSPVTIRVFGRFCRGPEDDSDDLDLLQPLERLANERPLVKLQVFDIRHNPGIVHHHFIEGPRIVRVFGADGRQVEYEALRELWPPLAIVHVEGRPTRFFALKHGFTAEELDRPIGEYEYTELFQLRQGQAKAAIVAAQELWMLPDGDGPEWGPFSRRHLVDLCDLGYILLTTPVRCLGQQQTQLLRDQRGCPAPDGTIVPDRKDMDFAALTYRRHRAIRHVRRLNHGSSNPPCPLPVLFDLEEPFCLRYAGYQWSGEPVGQIRIFFVSGTDCTAELRLFADRESPGGCEAQAEAACVSAFRTEREQMVTCGLLGNLHYQAELLIGELRSTRFIDRRRVMLRRWRSRAFERTVAVDEMIDLFLPWRTPDGTWALLRLSIGAWLREVMERDYAWITQWSTKLGEWLNFLATGQTSALRQAFGEAPPISPFPDTIPTEAGEVIEPYESCRGEVLWYATAPTEFSSETYLLRDAGIRVRFVRSVDLILAALSQPDLITVVLPVAKTSNDYDLVAEVRHHFKVRRDNRRIVAWAPDKTRQGPRAVGVSLCRRSNLLRAIGVELFRPRYPVPPPNLFRSSPY